MNYGDISDYLENHGFDMNGCIVKTALSGFSIWALRQPHPQDEWNKLIKQVEDWRK